MEIDTDALAESHFRDRDPAFVDEDENEAEILCLLNDFSVQVLCDVEETLAVMEVKGIAITKDILERMLKSAENAIEGEWYEHTL